ncbi:caspase family protein [Ralstonia sp. SM1864_UCD524_TZ4]|uniref:Peptidase C14 caspase catalytic subunit p20 n=1 Tax=Ralstonia solanacearum TaxID=305 RepID=A0A0S4VT80_RALSL|nr:caspase family protein [Ralstonia pseudosolanacearum]CUV26551.1 Peptidase C14 caspase catalytic subunit p20 [Ralstonia solanacearum]CUV37562.1 Peptidase C14 caspase catalytic subunit p20 [Ralstonia solanacearum]CUV42109.1 Peptidase C14 caspase catalytic subunit p20 [Ralstonia solanacearum]CUV64150.1 Peptidase C14 caspase catalytic subunit p20 [Ralstonia solanacearum]
MNSTGYPQGHALLIGVANYQKVSGLPAAILNDVNDVATMLSSPEYCAYAPANVVTLLDASATRAAVLKGLNELAARVGPDDTACVFFSGHGGIVGSPGNEDSVLVTVDSDLSDIEKTSISSNELAAALAQIKAKRLLVFIDACHAGGATISKSLTDGKGHTLKSGYTPSTFAKLAVGSGRALMASCRADEVSNVLIGARNSVFTTALLAGLRGAADKNASGCIKVFDLFNYISEEVPKLIPDDQHPIFKADNLEVNFAVALSQGGKKSPHNLENTPTAREEDPWSVLEEVLVELYPFGPRDQEVWSRAGGDLSRLQFHPTGQAAWHAALRTLKQGGGGKSINFGSLLGTAKEDFSNHPQLAMLQVP